MLSDVDDDGAWETEEDPGMKLDGVKAQVYGMRKRVDRKRMID